jgi:hypothetical protein
VEKKGRKAPREEIAVTIADPSVPWIAGSMWVKTRRLVMSDNTTKLVALSLSVKNTAV